MKLSNSRKWVDRMSLLLTLLLLLEVPVPGSAAGRAQPDSATVTTAMLRYYLARAITMQTLNTASPAEQRQDIAMLQHTGARFVGRAAGFWGTPHNLTEEQADFDITRQLVDSIHQAVPGAIVQGAIFEIICRQVDQLPVPTAVLAAFGQDTTAGPRAFRFRDMQYASYYNDPNTPYRWSTEEPGQAPGVPDISRLETRLWFYHRACRLLDAGCEAIHFGQLDIMNDQDPGNRYWWELLTKVRAYARARNRGFVLCDAHTIAAYHDPEPTQPLPLPQRQLLLDFHSLPCRPTETDTLANGAQGAYLEYRPDTGIRYGESGGGRTPSGEYCDHLPFLVELDNGGPAPKPGQRNGPPSVWGYDEISWFALQPDWYRSEWLIYAYDQVRALDPDAFLEMPGRRNLSGSLHPEQIYRATTLCANGTCTGQEETIRGIWAGRFARRAQELRLVGPPLPPL